MITVKKSADTWLLTLEKQPKSASDFADLTEGRFGVKRQMG